MLTRKNDKIDYKYLEYDDPIFHKDRLELLYEYIVQRYTIFKRRESGLNYEDWYEGLQPLFKYYKFTNIFREDDRVSKWLIDNISNNLKFSLEDRFWRSILFRLYNRIDTAEELNFLDENLWNRSDEENLKLLEGIHHDVYTRAFKTVGLKLQLGKYSENLNVKLGPLYFVKYLRNRYYDNSIETQIEWHPLNRNGKFSYDLNAESLYKWFLQFKGIGHFFAYQLFVDITYIRECPVSENCFVIAGPGCQRGLNELVEDWKNYSYEEMLFYLTDNLEEIFRKEIDPNFSCKELFSNRREYDQCFNVMSMENIFCEFKKYLYVRIYENRTKKYHYSGK